jgi:tRNA modification GTPase
MAETDGSLEKTRPVAEAGGDRSPRRNLSKGEMADLGLVPRTAAMASPTSAKMLLASGSGFAPTGGGPTDGGPVWMVRNKIDKINNNSMMDGSFGTERSPSLSTEHEFNKDESRLRFNVSALTGNGIDALLAALSRFAATALPAESGLITRARHRQMLEEVADHLRRFKTAHAEELAAEELRLAARALGRLTGRIDVEDVLDVIFRDFCVGK